MLVFTYIILKPHFEMRMKISFKKSIKKMTNKIKLFSLSSRSCIKMLCDNSNTFQNTFKKLHFIYFINLFEYVFIVVKFTSVYPTMCRYYRLQCVLFLTERSIRRIQCTLNVDISYCYIG